MPGQDCLRLLDTRGADLHGRGLVTARWRSEGARAASSLACCDGRQQLHQPGCGGYERTG
jgi:hypothetical protein